MYSFFSPWLHLNTHIPPNPFDFGIGDDRIVDNLSPEEVEILRKIVFNELGVEEGNPDYVQRHYVSKGSPESPAPGDIKVTVFRTNRESDGLFLQELTFPDGQKRLVVGVDKNI